MKIIDSCIVEGTGKVTAFNKEKLLASLSALDPVRFTQVFDHIVSLQHFYDRFSSGY